MRTITPKCESESWLPVEVLGSHGETAIFRNKMTVTVIALALHYHLMLFQLRKW